MSFPRYLAYKNSGVTWLGEVPEHWEVVQFRRCVHIAEGQVDPATPTFSSLALIAPNHIESGTGKLLAIETADAQGAVSGKYLCNAGDVLYSKIRPALRKVCIAPLECLCSADMYPLRPYSGLSGRFLKFQLLSDQFSALAVLESERVAMPKINRETLNEVALVRPPLQEQKSVADFLDRETFHIDALVAEQEHLIELLREKRQAVISHDVTKGLDSSVPMKDSGVEWLGEVPAHWTTPPLYARYSQALGKMLDSSKITGEHLLPYLRNVDVRWDFINTDGLDEMDIKPEERDRYTVRKGDLLIVEGRELGRGAIWHGPDGEVGFQKALHRLRPLSTRENVRFLFYTMSFANGTGVFFADQTPNEIPHLTGEELRRYRFPTPPIEEQDAIVQHLDQETGRIDALISEAERAITLLQERRAALISAAVTGQIDVRGLVSEVTA